MTEVQLPTIFLTMEQLHADAIAVTELVVSKTKTYRKPSDLTAGELSQLTYILRPSSNGRVSFGNPKEIQSVADCFNKRKVDDGLVFYKEMKSGAGEPSESDSDGDSSKHTTFHYWLGYFGGNSIGYLLLRGTGMDDQGGEYSGKDWSIIVENCDGDFIWRGPGSVTPKAFIKAVKKAAYGDKYFEEDE